MDDTLLASSWMDDYNVLPSDLPSIDPWASGEPTAEGSGAHGVGMAVASGAPMTTETMRSSEDSGSSLYSLLGSDANSWAPPGRELEWGPAGMPTQASLFPHHPSNYPLPSYLDPMSSIAVSSSGSAAKELRGDERCECCRGEGEHGNEATVRDVCEVVGETCVECKRRKVKCSCEYFPFLFRGQR